ncbi:hypothetical protein HYH03_006383 [Edaphochlamys debaryana]|uniref:C2 NT-type domain-containing protein n=1 Tax=Edaphochlamys debaryana TaxID=47281 RepID=A0A835Y3S7_9CHLO|nr:hypothetical protein HYH03_006383 [Edaphochlamys debaryana]|eukprot:KAG2495436.1 hypothetical protein HYH03_006383 [Edaphochlamys debaryana]
MFSFGSKVKQKLTATRFEFSFVVHNLAPWPEGARAIAIGYQRGKRRRGATRSVYPSRQPGRLGAVVRFNERFDMPVTLYKSGSGNSQASGGLGPFKKKCLILAVLETDGRTQATAALGRVVVDLSEYAAVEHQETRTFMVSCNKAIHAAVGDPQVMLTIRCRWKKLAREGPGAGGVPGQMDDTASMSTDTTGSRMTANLSSFLRFKFTGKAPNEEQDLGGFEGSGGGSGNGLAMRGSVPGDAASGVSKVMDTIQESHDEPAEPVFTTPQGSRNLTPQTSVKNLTPSGSMIGMEPSPHGSTPRNVLDSGMEGAVAGMSLREQHAARQRAAPYGSLMPGASSTLSLGAASASDSDLMVALRFELLTAAALEAAVYMARRPPGGLAAAVEATGSGAAAPPAAAAAAGTVLASAVRSAHLPARRLARTVLCMGPADGSPFGLAALRVVRAQVASAGDGLDTLAFWWTNTVHLRAMLNGLSLAAAAAGMLAPAGGGLGLALAAAAAGAGGGGGPTGAGASSGGSEHWAAAALVPDLRKLERGVFEELLGRMWEKVLLPTVLGRTGAKDARPSVAATKRALQEAAIKKWFEALEAVSNALSRQVQVFPPASGPAASTPPGGGGHCSLLRQQLLLSCLKRVDLLLFAHLLGGADQPGVADLLSDYDPHNSLAAPSIAPPGAVRSIPQLDDASLPFARGVLTFGGGMSVKMTVTRLQQWAAGQTVLGGSGAGAGPGADAAGVAGGAGSGLSFNSSGGGGGSGTGPLFPLLRAAADLLMMPKELLLDQAVRMDVGAALSMRSVLHILERFKPDEFAQDSISPAILESLQEDAALPQMHLRSAAADANSGYAPPHDALVLRGVEAGAEPGLEYDADSEDELEELAQVVARSSAASATAAAAAAGAAGGPRGSSFAAARFRLLHELWANGMPRRRGAQSIA